MKRIIGTAAFVAVAALAVTGCSASSTPDPSGGSKDVSGTLRVIDPWFGTDNVGAEAFDAVVADFHKEYPNVTVERDTATFGDLSQKLTTAVISGQNYDVVMSGFAWIPPLASLGAIQSMTKLGVTKDDVVKEIGEKNKVFLDPALYQDDVYAMPLATTGRVVAYSKSMFKAAGLDPDTTPKSLDEIMDYAKKLTIRDGDKLTQAGFDFKNAAGNYRQSFVGVLGALGQPLYINHTQPNWAGPEGVQALQWMTDMIDAGTSNYGDLDPSNQSGVYLGHAAMGLADTYVDCSADGIGQEKCDDLGFFSLEDKAPAMFVGGALASVGAGTKLPDAALAFVNALRSEDSLTAIAKAQKEIPLSDEKWADDFAQANPASAYFFKHLNDAVFEGGPTNWLDVRGLFGPAIDSALLHQQSAEDALNGLLDAASK